MDFNDAGLNLKDSELFTFESDYDTVYMGDCTPTVDDLKEDEIMSLSFAGNNVINVYTLCESGEKFIKDKSLLKGVFLYESSNVALATSNMKELVTGGDLVQVQLNLCRCLDLLDFGDVKRLQNYYDFVVKHNKLSSENIKTKLASSYIIENNIEVVRDLGVSTKNGKSIPIFKCAIMKQSFIRYRVFNANCIGAVTIINDKR